ncbi:uncharacterized protein LOC117216561 isoform X6 [Bombus bifarius]|uniref:Uncharacterized protein LOC117216561 isoform X6 n=1 Tax=Bombus bifarius TaxID=103933 RepID=A0A6P8NZ43_9HYME|nr:uncharacterized protein LOC117216561 isoform X6 [Bombus bifarius]
MDKRSERVSRFKRAGVSEARGAMNRVDHWRPKGDSSPSSARNGDTIRRCRRKASASGAITIPLVVIAKMPLLLATRRINQDTRATVILRWIPAPRIRRTLVRQPQSSQ